MSDKMIIVDGVEYWLIENKSKSLLSPFRFDFHRIDGPAIVNQTGIELWYVHGKRIDIKPILERLEISSDWRNWSDEEKFVVRLALP